MALAGLAALGLASLVSMGHPVAVRRSSPAPAARLALATPGADLARFKEADAALGPPRPGAPRIVFLGDSITQFWPLLWTFPGQRYLNRGIAGQTSAQILARFNQDVLGVSARVVVIQAGTNDLRFAIPPARTEANLAAMVSLAGAHGVGVVLCTLPPIQQFPVGDMPGSVAPETDDPAHIEDQVNQVNAWVRSFARRDRLVLVDYYPALAGAVAGWAPGLSTDGIHPTLDGYRRMASLVDGAVTDLLTEVHGARTDARRVA